MARPEIKDTRREQILDAFEICVARYGLEGATLAKTADQAGLARPLVRHNIGNRDELVDAMVERFLERSRNSTQALIDALPDDNRSRTTVEWLFDPRYSDPQFVRVSYALITYSADHVGIAEEMQSWLDEFIAQLEGVFGNEYPEADKEMIAAVAAGITGIYFNVESMRSLGNIGGLAETSKQAAMILLGSLSASA